MKLEAVVVCINYSDFLKVTLPNNKQFFDKLVVVTDEQDINTVKVCEFYNVQCIKTNAFYDDADRPGKPNKARGINIGLKALSLDGWVVQLDSDIWLPPMTRSILERQPLSKENIYGIDRMMCNSYADFYDFLYVKTKPVHEGWIYLHLDLFPLGQRITQYYGEGYMPIGYFQLWNPKGSNIFSYPVVQAAFDRTDILHLKQWKRERRAFIPELICIHLASEEHKQGQNWEGRKTRSFLPSKRLSIYKGIMGWIRKVCYRVTRFLADFFNGKERYFHIE
ncbi:MAG TPA: glycosyltransferase family A protein [Puia sp.]|jgi:hypothetical protein